MTGAPATPSPHLARLGPITLAPGITPRQVLSFIMFAVTMGCVVGFVPLMMPFVLADQLGLSREVHGRVTGTVQVIQQVASIAFISIFGALADRHGRRPFLLLAGVGIVLSALWFPFIGALPVLLVAMFVLGIAQVAQTAGGATSVVDYPDNNSRGKYIALMLLTQGSVAGLLTGRVAMRIPDWLKAEGVSPATANMAAFWFVAALGMVGIAFAWWGITVDRKPAASMQEKGVASEFRAAFLNLLDVLRYARVNKRFRLILLIACVVRSDFMIVASFLSLWVVGVATDQGVAAGAARAHAGNFFFLLSIATVVMPVMSGFIADRAPRIKFLMTALAFASIAYTATALIDDVFGMGAWVVIGLIGLSEGMIIVGAQSMLGEEAPVHLRGSSIGVFTLAGLIGVLLVSLAGGFAFDAIHASAPFVLVGFLNLIALAFAMNYEREKGTSASS